MKHANYTVQKYKHLCPQWLWTHLISPLGKTVLGLYEFTFGTGWLKSVWRSRPISRNGKPLPWLSYSCIEFLEAGNFWGRTVLEIGGGNSTLFFLGKGATVWCIEEEEDWQKEIEKQCTPAMRKRLNWVTSYQIEGSQTYFDLILIDANPRYDYLEFALRNTRCYLILIDNLEIPQANDKKHLGNLIGEWSAFSFVDFAPGNATQQCTTLFIDPQYNLHKHDWLLKTANTEMVIQHTSQKL